MTHEEHIQNKHRSAIAVKKAQGINIKVLEMIEQDAYCPDVIQQIDAIIGLLESTKKKLLNGHLHHCLEDNLAKDKKKAITELVKIFDLQ
jgi:DNA-binding FrmR family transcriptional regulator